jgi:division protein CdvB (Snf7/Vps24/ESCRT-III family)
VLSAADGFHAGSQVLDEMPEVVPTTGLDLFNKYFEQETEARKKKAADDAAEAQKARDDAEDAAEIAEYKADAARRAEQLKKEQEKNRKRKIAEAAGGDEGDS